MPIFIQYSGVGGGSTSAGIQGTLGGRLVNCLLHPLSATLPHGSYSISVPLRNSAYGIFALVSPIDPTSRKPLISGQGLEKWVTPWISGQGSEKWITPWVSGQGSEKWVTPWVMPTVLPSGAFLLTDRLLAGRRCIVVTTGFADLMHALQSGGGASIAVRRST